MSPWTGSISWNLSSSIPREEEALWFISQKQVTSYRSPASLIDGLPEAGIQIWIHHYKLGQIELFMGTLLPGLWLSYGPSERCSRESNNMAELGCKDILKM
jgi:hypothetical protein